MQQQKGALMPGIEDESLHAPEYEDEHASVRTNQDIQTMTGLEFIGYAEKDEAQQVPTSRRHTGSNEPYGAAVRGQATRCLRRLASTYIGVLSFFARIPFVYAAEFGDDATNDLFSDFGPLLSLFGEQVAKQFLATSTTWEDNILFALGPLGIVTAIVSAIRIGGPPWLRALIGRSRESRAIAEEELTTSTSQDVCEIWNGQSVVRLVGAPKIVQLVYLEDRSLQAEDRLLTLEAETRNGHKFEMQDKTVADSHLRYLWHFGRYFLPAQSTVPHDIEARTVPGNTETHIGAIAPNLFLNLRSRMSNWRRWEQRAFLILGVALQAGVLAFTGPTTYHPKLKFKFMKEGDPVESQAYPLTAVGTVLLVLGMWVCSFVVESSTREDVWEVRETGSIPSSCLPPQPTKPFRVFWLQQSGSVTDQQFDSYAIIARQQRTSLLTSRLRSTLRPSVTPTRVLPQSGKRKTQNAVHIENTTMQHHYPCRSAKLVRPSGTLQIITTLGSIISTVGFVLQFTGFRSSHFSAAIAQLITTAIMIVVRAYLRRGLALTPAAYRVPDGFEMEWMATRLAFEAEKMWSPDPELSYYMRIKSLFSTVTHPAGNSNGCTSLAADCNCNIFDGTCWNWGVHSGHDTSFFEFHSLSPGLLTSGCQRAVKCRERIGRLSRWNTPVSDAAISLSTAIDTIMNTLFADEKHTDMAWTMRGFRTPGDSTDSGLIYMTVKRQKSGWKSSATELEAVLALWLFSIRSQQTQVHTGGPDSNPESDWLRESDEARRVPALRRLGVARRDSAYIRDLMWYMEDAFAELHSINEETSIADSTLSSNLALDVHSTHIFGFKTAHGTAPADAKRKFRFSLKPLDARQPSFTNSGSEDSESWSLGMWSDAALEQHLVHDMFSSFMWCVGKKMERLKGKTEVVPISADDTPEEERWKSFRLRSESLINLTNNVVTVSGEWLGGLHGVLWSIVPPLSELDKLPEPMEIIDHVRDVSLAFEAVGNWPKAVAVHLFLFKLCKTFRVGSDTRKKATAVIFHFCSVISDLRREQEDFNTDEDLIEEARANETALLDALSELERDGGPDLLRKLLILYRLQNRPLLSFEARMKDLGIDVTNCRSSFKGFHGASALHLEALLKPVTDFVWEFEASEMNAQDELGLTPLHYHFFSQRPTTDSVLGLRSFWRGMNRQGEQAGKTTPPVRLNPKLVDISGWSTLHCAVAKPCNSAALEMLMSIVGLETAVRNTADYGLGQDLSGKTPFFYAQAKDVAQNLVSRGITALNLTARDGSDAILNVVRQGFDGPASVFLDVGANPKSTDGLGRTVLHWAAYHGHVELMRYLRKKGADPNARDSTDKLPLHWTRAGDMLGEEVWSILDLKTSDADIRDGKHQTVLHLGAKAGTLTLSSLQFLLGKDKNLLDAFDLHSISPLSYAAKNNHRETARLLLNAGADMQQRAVKVNNSTTALALAVEKGHDDIVRLLLNWGLQVNQRDTKNVGHDWIPWKGVGVFLICARRNHQHLVRIFFTRGADPHLQDVSQALKHAMEDGNESMALLLLRKGCQIERDFAIQRPGSAWLFSLACYKGLYETARIMLELGTEVDAVEAEATSGFWLDISAKSSEFPLDHTALYNATIAGQEPVVRLLLLHGALVNHEGADGRTALWQAVARGHVSLVRLLLRHGAHLGTRKVGIEQLPEPAEEIAIFLVEHDIPYKEFLEPLLVLDDPVAIGGPAETESTDVDDGSSQVSSSNAGSDISFVL
ncbi:ankyrin [Ascobolus immersus RN42]|uniref:Ankyrin n=1 Tax=Ascobolus immersus RN42 TaxID=1160509 RepID=A0A3N4I8B3_ASCIM|nr:ankyrin [Ascobolus immersus RN42]